MAKYKKRKDGRYATSIYLNKKRFYNDFRIRKK